MEINKDHLDAIYETLADKINGDEIVASFMSKFPVCTSFAYRSEKQSFSTIYYQVPKQDRAIKVIELSDISLESEFLDQVIRDTEYLIKKAREERQVLDFYLNKVRSL